MKILDVSDPLLREATTRIDLSNPPEYLYSFAKEMIDVMYKNNGLGLSANQVGKPYRMFVMRGSAEEGDFVVINPRIIEYGSEQVTLEEGCLSKPGFFVKIKRPRTIKVRFTVPSGESLTKVFDGLSARVFQHELDHLDGIVYTSRANRVHMEQAKSKYKKLMRQRKRAA